MHPYFIIKRYIVHVHVLHSTCTLACKSLRTPAGFVFLCRFNIEINWFVIKHSYLCPVSLLSSVLVIFLMFQDVWLSPSVYEASFATCFFCRVKPPCWMTSLRYLWAHEYTLLQKLKEHVDIMIFIERYPLKRCQGCVKLIASKVNCFLNINDLSEVQLCMSSNSWTWECPHTKDGADHVPLIFLSSVLTWAFKPMTTMVGKSFLWIFMRWYWWTNHRHV